ncbi:zinc finger BED domain-containing protein RICESLEEPER 2, partial [Tanacetum coccineum]
VGYCKHLLEAAKVHFDAAAELEDQQNKHRPAAIREEESRLTEEQKKVKLEKRKQEDELKKVSRAQMKIGRVVGLSENTGLKEMMRRADKVKRGKEKVAARRGRETRKQNKMNMKRIWLTQTIMNLRIKVNRLVDEDDDNQQDPLAARLEDSDADDDDAARPSAGRRISQWALMTMSQQRGLELGCLFAVSSSSLWLILPPAESRAFTIKSKNISKELNTMLTSWTTSKSQLTTVVECQCQQLQADRVDYHHLHLLDDSLDSQVHNSGDAGTSVLGKKDYKERYITQGLASMNPEAGQTTMGRDGQVFMYNPDYLREQFAGLVIQRGLPFNHFDNEQTTRVFQNTNAISAHTIHQTQSTTAEGSSSQKSRDPLSRMVHGLTQHKQKKAGHNVSEYEQYIKTDFVRGLQPKDYESYDVLGFWKTKENQFPVLSRMALDILSVQASSVASESKLFSTSG